MVKFSPRWLPFFKRVVKLPDNLLFRIIGSFIWPRNCFSIGSGRFLPCGTSTHGADDGQVRAQHDAADDSVACEEEGPRTRLGAREIYEANRGYF